MSLDIGDTATCLNRPVWQQLRDGKVLHSSSLDEDTKVEEWYLKTDVASCWCSCSHLVDLYIYLFFISPSHLKLFSVAAAASITFCFVFRPCACSHLVQKVETSSKQLFFPFQDSLFVFHCEVRALLNWISSSLSCFKNFSFICRWRCNCTKNNTDCCSAHAWALPHLAKTIQSIGNSLIVTIFWFYGNSILHNGPVFPSQ